VAYNDEIAGTGVGFGYTVRSCHVREEKKNETDTEGLSSGYLDSHRRFEEKWGGAAFDRFEISRAVIPSCVPD